MSDMNKPLIPLPQGDPIKDNMSVMNPVDMAAMKQSGEFTPEMTVRDVLAKFGIDVDGPAEQLVQLATKHIENADMMQKMKNIGGQGAQPEQAPPPPAPTAPQQLPGGGGLEGLLTQ